MTDIVCFGDSITKGNNDAQGGWPQRVSNFLSNIYVNDRRMPRHNVYNLGVDGDTSSTILDRLEIELKARSAFGKPVFLIQIGTNDSSLRQGKYLVKIEDYEKNLRQIVSIAKKGASKVIVVGLLPCQDDKLHQAPWAPEEEIVYLSANLKAYDRVSMRVAKEEGVDFIRLMGVFGKLELDTFLADGLHPSNVGYQYVADTLKKRVAEMANGYAEIEAKGVEQRG